jgi:lysozyme family protein
MTNFDAAFIRIVALEGGYSDDPRDPGGKTKFGITEAVARQHGYIGAMQALPLDVAGEIYRSDYWDACRAPSPTDQSSSRRTSDDFVAREQLHFW